jgi:hypothetical protein
VKILFKEQSFRIIGACFEVSKEKGNGFLEAVYQECLARELDEQEIPFQDRYAAWFANQFRPLPEDRARTVREPAPFACFAYFVVSVN